MAAPAVPAIGAVLGWLAGAVARFFAVRAVSWVAQKIFLMGLFTTVFPWVLSKVMYGSVPFVSQWIQSALGGYAFSDVAIQFTGLAAWLIGLLKLDICFRIIVSALLTRAMISMSPYIFGLNSLGNNPPPNN